MISRYRTGEPRPQYPLRIVTDLPDSAVPSNEEDPLVDLCTNLIKGLNEKYAGKKMGPSCCCTVTGFTTRAKKCGWDGSGQQQADGPEPAVKWRI